MSIYLVEPSEFSKFNPFKNHPDHCRRYITTPFNIKHYQLHSTCRQSN